MTTPEQRRTRARALVAAEPGTRTDPGGAAGWLHRLCRATVGTLPADGCVVSLLTVDGVRGIAAASATAWEDFEQLQFTLGQGPSLDAFSTRRPVLEPDLAESPAGRWPAYCAAAVERGVRAAFAFPVQLGAARLGAFAVYRSEPTTLSLSALGQALTFVEVALEALLDGQEHASAGGTEASLDRALDSQSVIYQAQGMAMVDLGISLADAMARLQAFAYANDRSLLEVARDVVDGRIRLEADGRTPGPL